MALDYPQSLYQSINSWFDELADIALKEKDSSKLPNLELLLSSGASIKGHVVAFKRDMPDPVLMLESIAGENNSAKISLLKASQVVALSLLDARNYFEQFVVPRHDQPMGNLEFKRNIQSLEKSIKEVLGFECMLVLDLDAFAESVRSEVCRTLALLPQIIKELTEDEIGKRMFKEAIESIKISLSEQLGTELVGKALQLQITSPINTPKQKLEKDLKTEIEKLL